MNRATLLEAAAVALAMAAIVGCGPSGRVESGLTRTGPPTPESQACSRDSECVLVDDCCGCENGGTRQAVRADAVESLESSADTGCAGRVCTDGVASGHRSCSASGAVCRGGRCIPQTNAAPAAAQPTAAATPADHGML